MSDPVLAASGFTVSEVDLSMRTKAPPRHELTSCRAKLNCTNLPHRGVTHALDGSGERRHDAGLQLRGLWNAHAAGLLPFTNLEASLD